MKKEEEKKLPRFCIENERKIRFFHYLKCKQYQT